jgi:hypothetical protein
MQPAETRRVLAVEHGVVALAVVFVRPGALPDDRIVGDEHAAFAARRHDLVLAERERARMPETAGDASVAGRAVALSAVFDHLQTVFSRDLEDRLHVARPAGEVYGNNRPCP